MRYVNLGCGSHYHPDWINIDIEPSGPGVIAHDLSTGIPLENDSCDVVYHSHVLEHIRRPDALPFIRECRRVLKPGGVLRIAVPDLERICRLYIQKLDAALEGDAAAAADYNWMLLEMYDQTVREKSGGAMGSYLRTRPLPNREFIFERIGEHGRAMVESLQNGNGTAGAAAHVPAERALSGKGRSAGEVLRKVRGRIVGALLGAKERRALEVGRFRMAGEVHQWMYDRFSLARLLREAGFVDPQVRSAADSLIPDWNRFHLDALADGSVVKPDSLFMEGVKP